MHIIIIILITNIILMQMNFGSDGTFPPPPIPKKKLATL